MSTFADPERLVAIRSPGPAGLMLQASTGSIVDFMDPVLLAIS